MSEDPYYLKAVADATRREAIHCAKEAVIEAAVHWREPGPHAVQKAARLIIAVDALRALQPGPEAR